MAKSERFLQPLSQQIPGHLDVHDLSPGAYIEIDLSKDRIKPEEIDHVSMFDTFTVTNHRELRGLNKPVWVYINVPSAQGKIPLHKVNQMSLHGLTFFLQHEPLFNEDGTPFILEVILGGDLSPKEPTDVEGEVAAHLQVGGAPVSKINPVPVDAEVNVDIEGANIESHLRVGGLPVSIGNPVPISGNVDISGPVQTVSSAYDDFLHNRVSITSAGQRVALSGADVLVSEVVVKALSSNTDSVFLGGIGVTSSNGFELEPGESIPLKINDLRILHVVSPAAGSAVTFFAQRYK